MTKSNTPTPVETTPYDGAPPKSNVNSALSLDEDEAARRVLSFFEKHLREVILFVIVLVSAWFIVKSYRVGVVREQEEITSKLQRVGKQLDELNTVIKRSVSVTPAPSPSVVPGDAAKEDAAKKEAEKNVVSVAAKTYDTVVKSLADDEGLGEFLAPAYQALGAVVQGNNDVKFPVPAVKVESAPEVVRDLQLLFVARNTKNMDSLVSLAKTSNFAAASAAHSIAVLAVTREQKEKAIKLIDEVVTRLPAQREVLTADIDRLKQYRIK